MTIKQDWNNWRIACGNTKKLQNKVKELSEEMTKPCSATQYWDNYIRKLDYGNLLKSMKNVDVDQKAIECRASSCFYKLVYDRPNEPKEETKLHDKCVHIRFDGSLDEKHCAGCVHREEMKDYIVLQNKLETARAEQYKSRDILLQHLFFWKQK